jgi:outer membrane protein TolC
MGWYETGLDPYLDVLTAQITVLSDEQTAAGLQIVNLIKALAKGAGLLLQFAECYLRRRGKLRAVPSVATG